MKPTPTQIYERCIPEANDAPPNATGATAEAITEIDRVRKLLEDAFEAAAERATKTAMLTTELGATLTTAPEDRERHAALWTAARDRLRDVETQIQELDALVTRAGMEARNRLATAQNELKAAIAGAKEAIGRIDEPALRELFESDLPAKVPAAPKVAGERHMAVSSSMVLQVTVTAEDEVPRALCSPDATKLKQLIDHGRAAIEGTPGLKATGAIRLRLDGKSGQRKDAA